MSLWIFLTSARYSCILCHVSIYKRKSEPHNLNRNVHSGSSSYSDVPEILNVLSNIHPVKTV